jgi:hypothetical protein
MSPLAGAGKAVGRSAQLDLAGLVTPDAMFACHRKLVVAKWDFLDFLPHRGNLCGRKTMGRTAPQARGNQRFHQVVSA